MTLNQMRQAGKIALDWFDNSIQPLTDSELTLAIKGIEQAIAFIHGGNDSWNLARFPLLEIQKKLKDHQASRNR